MNVALIGYRGSGKSAVGRKLANQLWQTFLDLDALIVKQAGKSIRDIFEQDGEPAFRDLETAALREAVQVPDHVLALGGGAVMREENRQILKSAGDKVIYLRCEAKVLLRRIEADVNTAANRPSLTALGGGLDEILVKLAEREPVYRSVMSVELDVTNLSIDEAVAYVARML